MEQSPISHLICAEPMTESSPAVLLSVQDIQVALEAGWSEPRNLQDLPPPSRRWAELLNHQPLSVITPSLKVYFSEGWTALQLPVSCPSTYFQNVVAKISTLCTSQRTWRVWWTGRFAPRSSTAVRSVRHVPGCMSQTACGPKSKSGCWTSTETSEWGTWVLILYRYCSDWYCTSSLPTDAVWIL